MSEQFSRSAREALARQTAADEHPSADLLNGFAEHALTADENARVTTHLAACADCREIVFLASAVEEEQEVAVAAAAQHVAAVAAQVPARMAEARPAMTSPERPRLAWLSWKWVAPAVAALAIGTIVVVHNLNRPISKPQMVAINGLSLPASPAQTNGLSAIIAKNDKASPAPLSPADEKKAKATVQAWLKQEEARRKEYEAKRELYQRQQLSNSLEIERNADMASSQMASPAAPNAVAGALAGRSAADAVVSKSMTRGIASPAPQSAATLPTGTAPAAGGARPPAAAPQMTAKAQAPALSNLPQNELRRGNDLTYAVQKSEPSSSWRISVDGHLLRASASGQWIPVLADEAVTFHAVALVGNDVWAGGSDGALFHSTDNGEHWTRVALVAGDQTARGAVRTIRFDSLANGQVTTDSGEAWSTSDGGKSWSWK
jgi:Photosynthesis system II assembly factor YCF48/Putative zinc-finger